MTKVAGRPALRVVPPSRSPSRSLVLEARGTGEGGFIVLDAGHEFDGLTHLKVEPSTGASKRTAWDLRCCRAVGALVAGIASRT